MNMPFAMWLMCAISIDRRSYLPAVKCSYRPGKTQKKMVSLGTQGFLRENWCALERGSYSAKRTGGKRGGEIGGALFQ